ncbi:MAG: hypothetical protein ACE5NP_10575 [Anaerolineae bacterium]
MRRLFPSAVAMAVGLIVLLDFFVTGTIVDRLGGALVSWAAIVAAFALILGLLNIFSVHFKRLASRRDGWLYSLALLLIMLIILVLGLSPGSKGPQAPGVAWIFNNVQFPLHATIFSLLAFYIATAAYRAFRVWSFASFLMLATGLVVLLGQVPIGRIIWPDLPTFKDWILEVPATAGARGIILGVALGTVATGLRLLLGMDRHRFFN